MSISEDGFNPKPNKPQLSTSAPEMTLASLIEEGRLVITPDLAQQILETFNYRNQRRIAKPHVSRLAYQMSKGRWISGSQIAFGEMPDKSIRLINGQHRLHALIESSSTIEFQVLMVPVKNDDDLHRAYYRFDTVQRGRSREAIMNSTNITEFVGISKATAKGAYSAGVYIAKSQFCSRIFAQSRTFDT